MNSCILCALLLLCCGIQFCSLYVDTACVYKASLICFLCSMVVLTAFWKFVVLQTRILGESYSQTGYNLIIWFHLVSKANHTWQVMDKVLWEAVAELALSSFPTSRNNTAHQLVWLYIKVLSNGNSQLHNTHCARHCLWNTKSMKEEEESRAKWHSWEPKGELFHFEAATFMHTEDCVWLTKGWEFSPLQLKSDDNFVLSNFWNVVAFLIKLLVTF